MRDQCLCFGALRDQTNQTHLQLCALHHQLLHLHSMHLSSFAGFVCRSLLGLLQLLLQLFSSLVGGIKSLLQVRHWQAHNHTGHVPVSMTWHDVTYQQVKSMLLFRDRQDQ